jgi:hypothetical protein
VIRYARPSDYVHGLVAFAFGPTALVAMERIAPSGVGKGGFAIGMRLCTFISFTGSFYYFYERSICTWSPSALDASRARVSNIKQC